MGRGLPSFIIAILISLTSCSQPRDEIMLDSFEGELNSQTVDFGSSPNSYLKVEPAKNLKICGEQSIKIIYELKPSGYMWVARGYKLDVKGAGKWLVKPQDIDWKDFDAFSVYMYGRNTQGIVALDIKDAGGEMWRFIINDDFQGWKEIICPFSQFFARTDWQPDNAKKNEILDFPINSFQFEPRSPGKGVYYFDCLKLIKRNR